MKKKIFKNLSLLYSCILVFSLLHEREFIFNYQPFQITISGSLIDLSDRRVRIAVNEKAEELGEEYFEEIDIPPSYDIYALSNEAQNLFNEMWGENWLQLFTRIKNIINPNDESSSGVYIASGSDVSTFFLISNAQDGYFITREKMTPNFSGINTKIQLEDYVNVKSEENVRKSLKGSFTTTEYLEKKGNLLIPLIWELLGIGAENIEILKHKINSNIYMIKFDWKYTGDEVSKSRRIVIFSETELNNKEDYLPFFPKGIDFCLEKALLVELTDTITDYRVRLLEVLKPEGMIVTDEVLNWMLPFEESTPLNTVGESLSLIDEFEEAKKFGHGTVKILRYTPTNLKPVEEANLDFLIKKIMKKRGINVPLLVRTYNVFKNMDIENRRKAFIGILNKFQKYTSYRLAFHYANLCVLIGMLSDLIPVDLIGVAESRMKKQTTHHFDYYDDMDDDGVFTLVKTLALDVIKAQHYGENPDNFLKIIFGDKRRDYYDHHIEYVISAAQVLQWFNPAFRKKLHEIAESEACSEEIRKLIEQILEYKI